jgi:hypothetical protein
LLVDRAIFDSFEKKGEKIKINQTFRSGGKQLII